MYQHSLAKKTAILLAGIFVLIGIVHAKDNQPQKEIDGMLLKEDAKVDLAYVRPGVDWKKFKTVYIRALNVTDEAKDATPDRKPKGRGHLRDSWIIPEKDIQLMKSEFTRIISESMEKGGLSIVEEVRADTLVIIPAIIDIYLKAPIERSRSSNNARGGVYTDGAGSMTLSAVYADGSSMQVIAYAVDNKYPSSMWSRNTRIQNISDMKRLFRSWGKMLAKSLSNIQE